VRINSPKRISIVALGLAVAIGGGAVPTARANTDSAWGNQVTWKYWWQNIFCAKTLQSSSIAKVPTTQMGCRFYETTY
jgi:hypothetical protein